MQSKIYKLKIMNDSLFTNIDSIAVAVQVAYNDSIVQDSLNQVANQGLIDAGATALMHLSTGNYIAAAVVSVVGLSGFLFYKFKVKKKK